MHKPRILCTLAALLVLCAALALPVSAGQPGGMEAPEDLAQKSVGVVTGAIYDQVLTARVPDARVNYFNNHTDEVAALLAGKIDALVTDEPMARYIVSQSPGLRILPEMLLLVLVGTVFVTSPAALLAMLTPEALSAPFWVAVILLYYLLATVLPIDKLIGNLYPVFGLSLIHI